HVRGIGVVGDVVRPRRSLVLGARFVGKPIGLVDVVRLGPRIEKRRRIRRQDDQLALVVERIGAAGTLEGAGGFRHRPTTKVKLESHIGLRPDEAANVAGRPRPGVRVVLAVLGMRPKRHLKYVLMSGVIYIWVLSWVSVLAAPSQASRKSCFLSCS